jgi:hypothetical protein
VNLRTLKKLSKRAAPLLVKLGDMREQFPSERGDNYHGYLITARKHWERRRVRPDYRPRNEYRTKRGAEILYWSRAGHPILLRTPTHPLKGTIMAGGNDCGEQPEWYECSAWGALEDLVRGHFTDWSGDGPIKTRTFKNPSEILQGARDIIKEMQNAEQ